MKIYQFIVFSLLSLGILQSCGHESSTATSWEYNNPDKKAQIYIISTNEEVEEKWLNKSLEFFDKDKIKVVNISEI